MLKKQIPHRQYIAKKDDIPVASKLGYLFLLHQYKGKDSTPEQVARSFSIADAVTCAGFETCFADNKKSPLTQAFYTNAREAIKNLPEEVRHDALNMALDELYEHNKVA